MKIIFSLLMVFLFSAPLIGQSQSLSASLGWTSNTYVPPGYPGRPLPSRGSEAEVAVQLHNPKLNPQNLLFDWFINNNIQKGASGKGKDILKFNIGESITKIHSISVKITNPNDGSVFETDSLAIRASEPKIIIRPNPLSGYQISSNQSVEFMARPYFFDINTLDQLDYQWTFNDQQPGNSSGEPNIMVLKIGKVDQATEQSLKVSVENKNKRIQSSWNQIRLIFKP